ncbi:hypothetical protein BKA93DRAFT_142398 [Sparassis latifolia]
MQTLLRSHLRRRCCTSDCHGPWSIVHKPLVAASESGLHGPLSLVPAWPLVRLGLRHGQSGTFPISRVNHRSDLILVRHTPRAAGELRSNRVLVISKSLGIVLKSNFVTRWTSAISDACSNLLAKVATKEKARQHHYFPSMADCSEGLLEKGHAGIDLGSIFSTASSPKASAFFIYRNGCRPHTRRQRLGTQRTYRHLDH